MKKSFLILLLIISLSFLFSCAKQVPPDNHDDVIGDNTENGSGENNIDEEEALEFAEKNKDCTVQYYLNDDETYLISIKGNIPTESFFVPYKYKGKVVSEVRLEENITYVPENAFANPSAINELIIGKDVQSFAIYALSGCTNLKKITFPLLTERLDSLFADVLPDTVTTIAVLGGDTIPDHAFASLKKLCKVELPEGITEIGERAFFDCVSLTSVNLPNGVLSIGNDAFSGCVALRNIKFPETITKIGSRAFFGCSEISEFILPTSLESIGIETFANCSAVCEIVIPDSVNTIGDGAFGACTKLSSVKLPNGIKAIGNRMFTSCVSLKYVELPEGITKISEYAFQNCTSLKEITLPETLEEIGKCAFEDCSALLTVVIPDKIKRIETYTFLGCKNLRSITFGKAVSYIDSNAFTECKLIWELVDNANAYSFIEGSEGYDILGKYTKYIHTNEAWVKISDDFLFIRDDYDEEFYLLAYTGFENNPTLPDSYNLQSYNIAPNAFSGADNIGKLVIPDCVRKIGEYAFSDCTNLVSVTLGTGVNSIGKDAFAGCRKLIEVVNNSPLSLDPDKGEFGQLVHLADTVHSGESFVEYLYGYIFISVDGSNRLIGYLGTIDTLTLPESFMGGSYEIWRRAFADMTHIKEVTIPNSVTAINSGAFMNCTALEKINIPSSVKKIGSQAFSGCKSLKKISIPEGISYIDEGVFENCAALETAELADSITIIGDTAFYYCTSLKKINIPLSLVEIGDSAFNNCSSLCEILFNEGLEMIGSRAFLGCSSVRTVWLPDSITDIGGSAFYHCESLVSLRVGKGLTSTYSWLPTGVALIEIINHSDMSLVNDGSIKVIHSDSESRIKNEGDLMFITDANGINYLIGYTGNASTLILPKDYNGEQYVIADYAFNSCNSLISIVVPETLKNIGIRVTPESLRYVYYYGTEYDWKKIVPSYFLYDEIFFAEEWYLDKYGNIRIK